MGGLGINRRVYIEVEKGILGISGIGKKEGEGGWEKKIAGKYFV